MKLWLNIGLSPCAQAYISFANNIQQNIDEVELISCVHVYNNTVLE